MKKITENELKTSTNMLKEYMRIIEATDPVADLANLDRQIATARAQGNNAEVSRLFRERPALLQKVSQQQRVAPAAPAAPAGLTLSPEAEKSHQVALAQLKARSDQDPAAKDAYDALSKTTSTAHTVTPSPVAGATPTVTSTTQNLDAQQYDDWASSAPAAKPATTKASAKPATTKASAKPATTKASAKPAAASSAKSDPFIVATQQDLNKRLAQIGKPPIKVDGINSPQTRAALRTVMDYEHVNRRQRAAQPAPTPATQPTPRVSGADQARGAFATESVRYGEDPTLARIIGLAGL